MKKYALPLMFAALAASPLSALSAAAAPPSPAATPAPKHPGAYPGYTLIATNDSPSAYLIDLDGNIVHTWQTAAAPASSSYLLDNGNLLRPLAPAGGAGGAGAGRGRGAATRPTGAAAGGRIQEIALDGTIAWDFDYETPTQAPHHDVVKLPNGNYLFISWDKKTPEECLAAGRKPEYQATGDLPPDCIFEVKSTGKSGGTIVWEWHVWDHMIQDFDNDKPNYGDVAAHPELIDINYSESWMDPPAPGAGRRGPAAAPPAPLGAAGAPPVAGGPPPAAPAAPGAGRAGGFGGGFGGGGGAAAGRIGTTDWTHLNAIAYNPDLDQIVVSSYTFSEFWIIDHTTTTAQAKSHAGGKSGKGGDLLYRWGNPEANRHGTGADQTLFCPHNVQWIDKGLNGEGRILIFNNGPNRPSGERYSEVDEFELPIDKQGHYSRDPSAAFTAPKLAWNYTAPNKTDFYSQNISSAQRLPNGNTLICSGAVGKLFEVTATKEIVWQYTIPQAMGARGGPNAGGPGRAGPAGGPGGPGARGPGGGPNANGPRIFRALRYAPDYQGLKGNALDASKPQ